MATYDIVLPRLGEAVMAGEFLNKPVGYLEQFDTNQIL